MVSTGKQNTHFVPLGIYQLHLPFAYHTENQLLDFIIDQISNLYSNLYIKFVNRLFASYFEQNFIPYFEISISTLIRKTIFHI